MKLIGWEQCSEAKLVELHTKPFAMSLLDVTHRWPSISNPSLLPPCIAFLHSSFHSPLFKFTKLRPVVVCMSGSAPALEHLAALSRGRNVAASLVLACHLWLLLLLLMPLHLRAVPLPQLQLPGSAAGNLRKVVLGFTLVVWDGKIDMK